MPFNDRKLLRLQALGVLTNQKPFMSVSKTDSINVILYTSSRPRAVWLDWTCERCSPRALHASCPHALCRPLLPPRPFSCCLHSRIRQQPYLGRCPLGFVCHPQLDWQVISGTSSLSAELEKHRTKSGKASSLLKPAWALPEHLTLTVTPHGLSLHILPSDSVWQTETLICNLLLSA